MAERGRRRMDSRSIQVVLQTDLENHELGKEDLVVELRNELVRLHRFYSPLFLLELNARIEARKLELAPILDAATMADLQTLLGTNAVGIPTADAWDWIACRASSVRAFAWEKLDWPIDFPRSAPIHLDHPRTLLDFAASVIASGEWLLFNLGKESS